MRLPLYQIDAFTGAVFGGNPAAVCPLEGWLEDALLQAIAAENNLSETAFLVPKGPQAEEYALRWFTPLVEVDLCGHATLASAYVVFHFLEPERESVSFHTRSGPLRVTREGDLLAMDFPAWEVSPCEAPATLPTALGGAPQEAFKSRDWLVVYETEAEVRAIRPDMAQLAQPNARGVIVTAPGESCDFVSRFFAPSVGIPEDPVTGSAHCALAPFWAARLGKTRLEARQVSARGGELLCEVRGDRVVISGRAARYLEGAIYV